MGPLQQASTDVPDGNAAPTDLLADIEKDVLTYLEFGLSWARHDQRKMLAAADATERYEWAQRFYMRVNLLIELRAAATDSCAKLGSIPRERPREK